jgi:hypothetical protein
MKMSPPWVNFSTGVEEFGTAIVDRNLPIEGFNELDFRPGEAEALRLGRDLEAASIPLHDVVVADAALVMKAADALEIFGSGSPSFFCFARCTAEAAVVVVQEAAQDLVGGVQIMGAGQAQLAGEAILKGAPETFDASLSLRTVGSDVGDAELFQRAAKLCGFTAADKFFLHRPVIVVAHEDAVAISVEAERNAEAAQQAVEQAKITAGVFGGEEFGDQHFARGIVEEAEQSKLGATILQPAMKAGVEQQHLAFASACETALSMGGSATFAGRADPGRAQQTAKGLAPEREAFLLDQFFAEVMIVEAGIGGAGQMQDAVPQAIRQATVAGSAAAGVCQSRLTALP